MKEWKENRNWLGGNPQMENRERPVFSGLVSEEGKKAREKGLYYLQFSAKTEKEMGEKLAEQGFSPASVSYAIDFLKQYRYLNDEDYVRRYLEKNGLKKSERQLRFELQRKGVSEEILETAFREQPVNEEAQILKLLEKRRFSGREEDRAEWQKQAAYFSRKGFSYDAIHSAMFKYARKDTE